MARRSLKPQLNQIRAWVRQGRTDAWIAHQLEVSAAELREFRSQHGFTPDEEDGGAQEVDLRDEIEAEIEAAAAEEAEKEAEAAPEEAEEDDEVEDAEDSEDAEEEGDADAEPKSAASKRQRSGAGRQGGGEAREGSGEGRPRRRRRRGRRGRGRKDLEATFDHGETDGYGLWLDASIADNPVYTEHWAGKREVTVRVDADQIVIRRAGEPAGGQGGSGGERDDVEE